MGEAKTKRYLGAAVGIWLVQLLLSGVFFLHMFLSQLSVASCTDTSCDYSLYGAIMRTFNTSLAAALFLSAVGIVATRTRGRWVVAAPIVGIVAATTLLFIAYPLSRAALELPLFGSRV
jgi:hypothetical protein